MTHVFTDLHQFLFSTSFFQFLRPHTHTRRLTHWRTEGKRCEVKSYKFIL